MSLADILHLFQQRLFIN